MLIIYITDHNISGRRYSQTNQLPIDGGHSYHELFEQKIESVNTVSFFYIHFSASGQAKKKKERKVPPRLLHNV